MKRLLVYTLPSDITLPFDPFILNEITMYVPGFYIPPTAARISGSAIHQSIAYLSAVFYYSSGIPKTKLM